MQLLVQGNQSQHHFKTNFGEYKLTKSVVLLVEETEYPEQTIALPQVTDKLYHIILYRADLAIIGIRTQNFDDDIH
jgi:hypothetical protein